MQVIYSDQMVLPAKFPCSIFLAGPSPRKPSVPSWRKQEALPLLEKIGFKGIALVPEPRHTIREKFDYINQVEWEYHCLEHASLIMFWVPRDLENLPGFVTNVEFGRYVSDPNRYIIYGRPVNAPNTRYLDWLYKKMGRGMIFDNLEEMLKYGCKTLVSPC